MDLVPKEEPLSLTEAVTCSDLQDYSTASFCAFIFKARNFSQKDCTMFTIIMQEWKAIKLSNKKKPSLNSESLFTLHKYFVYEPEKYQRSENKCTSCNSKFHLKKQN